MADSTTGGYIAATSVDPEDDDLLDRLFHDIVAGITGLDATSVMPRWQPETPNFPDGEWAAFGVTGRRGDTFPLNDHDGDAEGGLGVDELVMNEELDVLVSFYGRATQANASRLRDGLAISQNLEEMRAAGLILGWVGEHSRVPSLVKNRWVNRTDLPIKFRRQYVRTYPVRNIVSVHGEIIAGDLEVTFNTAL